MRRLKQYDNIKGTEWKKIINKIIKQYRKIDNQAFQTGIQMERRSDQMDNRE
jgi:hypothetical protein